MNQEGVPIPLVQEFHLNENENQGEYEQQYHHSHLHFNAPYLGLEPLYPSRSRLSKRMLMKLVASRLQHQHPQKEDAVDNGVDDGVVTAASSATNSTANSNSTTLPLSPSTTSEYSSESAPISLPRPDFFNLDHDFTSSTSFSSGSRDVDDGQYF